MAQTMIQDDDSPSPTYTGKVQPSVGEFTADGRPLTPYLPNDDLVEAVNLALYLRRPLLLRGEPGCGKTRLAQAIAYELHMPYLAWYVKSTSRGRDGLYIYDTLARLRDAQLANSQRLPVEQIARLDDPSTYVRWGVLGQAFRNKQRSVVLIDEIDKADIDFPNDLLLELDESRFVVEETGVEVRARHAPLVCITSNDEKELPDAFLRRCLFHYVTFPSTARLIEIVWAHFPTADVDLVNAAVERFTSLRSDMLEQKGESGKKVSTSELLDWFQILKMHPKDEALALLHGRLPFASVLLKSWDDHMRYLSGGS